MVRLSKITAEDCRFALAAATQVIAYHFIIDGRLILTVEGEPPIEVRAGEVVLLPRNEASVRFTASELINGRFASPNIMSRLSELLLVEAVRDYSSTLGGQEAGWLKGLADPQVGWALALIHRNIGLSWSGRGLGKGGRIVAECIRGLLHSARRHAAHPISHGLAAANCQVEPAGETDADRQARAFSWLRIRRGV
jgi:hypothetical protein